VNDYPKVGSKWVHIRTGTVYAVKLMANTGSDRPNFRDTVVYERCKDGEVFARELEVWRAKMAPLEEMP
jgi:hypothetical protein